MKIHTGVRGGSRAGHYLPERVHTSDPMTRLGKRVEIQGECWVVNGEPDQYHMVMAHGTEYAAHRYVFAQVKNVVLTADDVIHHKCENPGCINPEHLQVTTHADHMRIHQRGSDYESHARKTHLMEWQMGEREEFPY